MENKKTKLTISGTAKKSIKNIEIAKATHGGRLSQDGGQIGMLSKMGGRMMHYYSDDLTELLLDDIL